MHSVEPTPDNPPEPACPTCGRPAKSTGLITDRGVVTGNYGCDRGHIWITRWMVSA